MLILLWFTLNLVVAVRKAEVELSGPVAVSCAYKETERKLKMRNVSRTNEWGNVDWYLSTNMLPEMCDRFFIYYAKYDRFVSSFVPHEFPTECVVESPHEPIRVCADEKGSDWWKSAERWIKEQCVGKLCSLAKTGKWKSESNWFKQRAAKKQPWPAMMPGDKELGYEEAFLSKCWRGPKGFEDTMRNFADLAGYNLVTGGFFDPNSFYCALTEPFQED